MHAVAKMGYFLWDLLVFSEAGAFILCILRVLSKTTILIENANSYHSVRSEEFNKNLLIYY